VSNRGQSDGGQSTVHGFSSVITRTGGTVLRATLNRGGKEEAVRDRSRAVRGRHLGALVWVLLLVTAAGLASVLRGAAVAQAGMRGQPVASEWRAPGGDDLTWLIEQEGQSGPGEQALPDPLASDSILVWHTFMGSPSRDYARDIALDASGSRLYVIGTSYAAWGAPLIPYAGKDDAFVAKLDSSGTLVWHTFLGSSNIDHGIGIAVDEAGNVYVTGDSDTAWGTPLDPGQSHPGFSDCFVAKLDSGGTLLWHTFVGSIAGDHAVGIAVDGEGNVYVTGDGWPAWGADPKPEEHNWSTDVFVAKLDSNGTLLWHTFLGSSSNFDFGGDIALGPRGSVYVTGESELMWGVPLNPPSGQSDAFVAKLNGNGSLLWHTFLGGRGRDRGRDIVVDGKGNAYVLGDDEAAWGAPVNPYAGGYEAFVAKLDSGGALLWHTFMGSPSFDLSDDITLDPGGSVYVTGSSWATWGAPLVPYAGKGDAFVVKLSNGGALLWNAFLGSSGLADNGRGIAVDGNDGVYVTGESAAGWGTPLHPHAGGDDGFVARLDEWRAFKYRAYQPVVVLASD
jgi:hypothetical protein